MTAGRAIRARNRYSISFFPAVVSGRFYRGFTVTYWARLVAEGDLRSSVRGVETQGVNGSIPFFLGSGDGREKRTFLSVAVAVAIVPVEAGKVLVAVVMVPENTAVVDSPAA